MEIQAIIKSQKAINTTNNSYMPTIEKISRENIELHDAVKRRTAELTIRTKTDHGIVIIEVEDNGPRIPDEIKDKILQPFFTIKPTGQGMGLGLSLSL